MDTQIIVKEENCVKYESCVDVSQPDASDRHVNLAEIKQEKGKEDDSVQSFNLQIKSEAYDQNVNIKCEADDDLYKIESLENEELDIKTEIDSDDVDQAMKTPIEEKPFQCNLCDCKYFWKSSLQKHMEIHIGEKPLQCNVCVYKRNGLQEKGWKSCYGKNASETSKMDAAMVATEVNDSNVESMQMDNEIHFKVTAPINYKVEDMLETDQEIIIKEDELMIEDVRIYDIENDNWDDDSIIESSESEYAPSEGEADRYDNSEDEEEEEEEESSKEASDDQPISCEEKNSQKKSIAKCQKNETYTCNALKNEFYNFNSGLARENTVLIVNACKDEITGKRIRNKVHSCYFCHKTIKQLATHFEKVHSNESEVAKLLALPKKSKERRNGFGNLLKIGDYYHNCEILTRKEGELILVRRPTSQESVFLNYSDYGPCPDCLGFMLKKHLWHHLKVGCTAKKINEGRTMHRKPMSESAALIWHTFGDTLSNDFSINILAKLKQDKVSLVCRQDNLIMKFGALQFEKYHNTQCELVRQSMRQLSRLVLELRRLDPSKVWLLQWLSPECFDLVVSAVKNICFVCYQKTNSPQFSIPSLALKLGHGLRKCIAIERGTCLRKGDLKRNDNLNSLLSIMDLEWNIKISSNALDTLYNTKLNATELLPLTDDFTSAEASIARKRTTTRRTTPKDAISIKKAIARKSTKCSGWAAAIKKSWSEQESGAVVSFFRTAIEASKVPGKAKCEECIDSHRDVLSSRSWKDVKYYVKNYLTKLKRENKSF